MRARIAAMCGFAMYIGCSASFADEADVADGKKLYEKECMVCHGSNETEANNEQRGVPQRLAHGAPWPLGATLIDTDNHSLSGDWANSLAVAPPYGPNLRGVIGRAAGTVAKYPYSATFLKSLQGMIWDEGSMDVWITSTQRWIPGVNMFYSQKNPDIRRKIILFLKAN